MAHPSLPLYPGRPAKPRNHRLGLWDGKVLSFLDETGQWRHMHCDGYDDFVRFCLNHKLDVRSESILSFQWLAGAIDDPRATVNASQSRADLHPDIVSITWREGNKWASLFSATSWGDGVTKDAVVIHVHTCQHLNVGVFASPSALGQATIRAHLPKWHTTMPEPCSRDLLENLNGGRAELYSPGWYPIAYELDRRMAYVSEATQSLPIGAPICLGACGLEIINRYPHWFGRCVVIVPTNLRIGPFPFRMPSGRLSFPVDAGHYVTWLHKEEAQDAMNAGCLIFPERAWAWERSEPVLCPWAEWIYAKRMDAPTPDVAAYVKKVAVAGLGYFTMRGQRLVVRLATDDVDEKIIVNSQGWPTRYVAVPDSKARPAPIMPHWGSYIHMQARRSLYLEQVRLQASGIRVLATDFDSLTVGDSVGSSSSALGEWRERTLTEVQLSVPRHLRSNELVKTPGVPR